MPNYLRAYARIPAASVAPGLRWVYTDRVHVDRVQMVQGRGCGARQTHLWNLLSREIRQAELSEKHS